MTTSGYDSIFRVKSTATKVGGLGPWALAGGGRVGLPLKADLPGHPESFSKGKARR